MALSIDTAEKLSTLPFLEATDALKKEVMSFRPLTEEKEGKVMQKFRLDWNYHSNAIEGNQLSYGETVAFLMEGLTAKGKPFKDHLDIKGHNEAIEYLLSLIKDKDYSLNESEIRNLHSLVLKENYFTDAITPNGFPTRKEIKVGQYKSSHNHVKTPTGEIHYYASPEEVPIKMGELMDWYKQAKEDTAIHPVVLAALFHHEFTAIHPFDDGNGRMGRLLLNLMLMQNNYPPIVVKQNDRSNYYQVLRQADAGELIPITEYIAELVKHSLSIYIKAAKGESFEEEDDIDKEIALFKKSLNEDVLKYKKETVYVEKAIKELTAPFFKLLFLKLNSFNDLFIDVNKTINISREILGQKENKSLEIIDEFDNPDNYFFISFTSNEFPFNSKNFSSYTEIEEFDLEITFKGFKKTKQPVTIQLRYKTAFDEFDFFILRQNEHVPLLREVYGQNKSKEELNIAVANEVKYFMEQLKQFSK